MSRAVNLLCIAPSDLGPPSRSRALWRRTGTAGKRWRANFGEWKWRSMASGSSCSIRRSVSRRRCLRKRGVRVGIRRVLSGASGEQNIRRRDRRRHAHLANRHHRPHAHDARFHGDGRRRRNGRRGQARHVRRGAGHRRARILRSEGARRCIHGPTGARAVAGPCAISPNVLCTATSGGPAILAYNCSPVVRRSS